MAETVRLTVLTGPHKGHRFCFRGPAQCMLGRADDCFVCLAGTERDQRISRHHCQLSIDPPCVWVDDLGSLNGTYVNGKGIHQDVAAKDLAGLLQGRVANGAMSSGDMLTVGGTTFQVDIVDCPPPLLEAAQAEAVWKPDEVAKKDCRISC